MDALLLEDGLSRNTLAAYRRDLTAWGRWLAHQRPPLALDAAGELELQGYFAVRVEQTKASSSNRRLTALRRYYHWRCASSALPPIPRHACWRPGSRRACRIR